MPLIDLTAEFRILCNAIKDTRSMKGRTTIIRLIRGKAGEKQAQYTGRAWSGAGKDKSAAYWEAVMDAAIAERLVRLDPTIVRDRSYIAVVLVTAGKNLLADPAATITCNFDYVEPVRVSGKERYWHVVKEGKTVTKIVEEFKTKQQTVVENIAATVSKGGLYELGDDYDTLAYNFMTTTCEMAPELIEAISAAVQSLGVVTAWNLTATGHVGLETYKLTPILECMTTTYKIDPPWDALRLFVACMVGFNHRLPTDK